MKKKLSQPLRKTLVFKFDIRVSFKNGQAFSHKKSLKKKDFSSPMKKRNKNDKKQV